MSAHDFVHDCAYDHYGRRVATCSSDNSIKIFDEAGERVAEWKTTHSGSIWRLSWAHPEFGVALASCSFDRKIMIWEETTDAEEAVTPMDGAAARVAAWPKVAEIADARDSVVDVQFAPHHMGVRLASCGADGFVRVHEAPDVLDLSSWELHSEFDAAAETSDSGGGGGGPAAATGGGGGGGSGGGAGSASGSAAVAAAAGADGNGDARRAEPLCLAWGSSIVEGPMLVVGMSDGSAVLWSYSESGWARVLALGVGGSRCHADCVRSVSWAADVGRSYQLLATGSRDKTVKLWAVQRPSPPTEDDDEGAWAAAAAAEEAAGDDEVDGPPAVDAVGDGWTARCCADLPMNSQVWRVSWNASGSMLATSEDDGNVQIFKMDSAGSWRQSKPVVID